MLSAETSSGLFDPATSSLLTALNTISSKVGPYIPTVLHILEDPALPKVARKIETLRSFEVSARADAKAQNQPQPGPPGPVGIGLWRIATVLDAYIWTREHPWAFRGILAGGLLTIFGIGFSVGRLSAK